MDSRDDILAKIAKCMALAKSGSEHEAAAALRQAQKLMQMHQVSQAEILAAGVTEAKAKAGAIDRPAQWENMLASRIAHVFGCKLIFSTGWSESHWLFIGLPPSNDVAAYSFEVLLRQALKSRREFIATQLKRYKRSNKSRHADLYSEGWVRAACAHVSALTPVEGAAEAIQAHMDLKHANLGQLSTTDRNAGRELSRKGEAALHAGMQAGRGARLHSGVGAAPSPRLIGD